MTQKTVLITGGARRIGAALARGFAAKGYRISLHYRNSKAEAEAVAAETGASLFQADLTDSNAASTLIKQVYAQHPDLSLLINNASTFRRSPLMQTTEQSIDEDLAINLQAPLNLMREFAATVEHGTVVNLLDVSINTQRHTHFAYLLAKKALAEATTMAAAEWQGRIRANGLCLGHILPTENDHAHEPASQSQAVATLEEVIEAAFKLGDDESLNGQFITLDGNQEPLI